MLLIKIADLDRQARRLSLSLPDNISKLVLSSAQGTSIGGSWWRQLRGTAPECPTDAAVVGVQSIGRKLVGEQSKTNHQIYTLLLKKQELVARARRDVKLKAWIDIWLYAHVPLSIALLVALAIHIVSVFFYW
jgi:predicted Zn-dependent protease